MVSRIFLALLFTFYVSAQGPNTFPHDYPGKPSSDFSPQWQSYFEVTQPLPGIDFALQRSFAGNIPVNRPDHPNCTLFFWAFEKANGSLTGSSTKDPWIIWLNGGPGASSLYGLLLENGPLTVGSDFQLRPNPFSWSNLSDVVWVDQPVGTGFSTSDPTGYVSNEDEMGQDFLGFLSNLVKVFPSLATRPLYITGESYAGTYIPYIVKAIFSAPSPPVNLAKFVIGDGTIGDSNLMEEIPSVSIIETWPQLIGFDTEVYNYFKSQQHLCGFDIKWTYPQNTTIPKPVFIGPDDVASDVLSNRMRRIMSSGTLAPAQFHLKNLIRRFPKTEKREPMRSRALGKRNLEGRVNGTVDPFYGCFQLSMLLDYAVNFTEPWSETQGIDIYDVPDALNPEAPTDASRFLNDEQTRSAIHAPTSKNWALIFPYPFGASGSNEGHTNQFSDPSVEPMAFFSELMANASKGRIAAVLYSGNDDMILAHRGTELVIQNTTWGGTRGFTQQPSTPWYNDHGGFAGIVHQERNMTYVLFEGAGHEVPRFQPENAFVFLREFVLGKNTTGLVNLKTGTVTGGTNDTLKAGVLPQYGSPIFVGSSTTSGSTIYPSETIEAWKSFIATASTAINPASTNVNPSSKSQNEARRLNRDYPLAVTIAVILLYLLIPSY